ncbi:MBL fold metallo-hydrolase [Halogeometricum borinquense]|uniref:MBL fold metallo-hydrolase n=1 Tax=Halogeometricum borinquense TaxID=60847 RepID=A0A6C0UK72_9EURY|nr:MBL fold metallo-hydrolase [Halogeometricum borinquense]QIB74721.1 MBL fold metallo-hydrolase [Halogeometricum borinquense]QIQ76324.1 MBL fold metallo-hydrolase [Halogeometricum borinquense]
MITSLAHDVQAFTSNVFLVTGDTTALVDVGANFDVVSRVRDHVDELDRVYITHTHRDHVDNVASVREAFDVETWGFDPDRAEVNHAIADGETVQIGDDDYEALHTPGHKNDHLCFYSRDASVLFAGDLVFANGSFGRTDLEEGDRPTLIESLDRVRETIDETLSEMHTGHGPSVTERPFDDVELAGRAARMR